MRIAAIASLVACWLLLGATSAHADKASRLGFNTDPLGKEAPAAKGPSVLDKMNAGTKRLVDNTKKLFTPDKPPVKKRGVTAVRRAQKPKPPQQSFFGRLFNPQPPPPPQTIDEWMSLDQLRP